MAPLTKTSVVLDGRRADAATWAVRHTLTGRPGAVHVDIDPGFVGSTQPAADAPTGHSDPRRALELIAAARRPVIIAGVGVVAQSMSGRAATIAAIAAIGRSHHVPVLCTYKARGVDRSSRFGGVSARRRVGKSP